MSRFWPEPRVRAERLAAQVAAILRSWGMDDGQVAITVGHMLYADLHGIDSHGCAMLRDYHRGVLDGSLCMTPSIALVRDSGATAILDGGGGLGHGPADRAMRLAMEKAREAGIGAVAVRNSGHYGAAGSYAALAAEAGLIGVATTSTAHPSVVPTFGREARLGTNPIAVAAPGLRNPPFLLDMATSTVPVGRVGLESRRGRPIPEGWALDADGSPLTDAAKALAARRLTPLGSRPELGSHKGYGLAVAVEILSSVLSGPRSGRVGHFFLAIDPGRFGEPGDFGRDLDLLLDALRASPPIDPGRPVRVAGDPEREAEAERRRNGIPLLRSVLEDVRLVCQGSGVPFVLDPEA